MKKLVSCKNRMEAEIIKSKLKAFGIDVIIESDDISYLRPDLNQASGAVKILVAEDDFEDALKIFKAK